MPETSECSNPLYILYLTPEQVIRQWVEAIRIIQELHRLILIAMSYKPPISIETNQIYANHHP